MDLAEKMARKYIQGSGGLFDLYQYEMASPTVSVPEIEGARWLLVCLSKPQNREDLDTLIHYADAEMRIAEKVSDPKNGGD